MEEILEPAIRMAKEGVPHYEINARSVGLMDQVTTLRGLMSSGKRARDSSKRCRLTGESELLHLSPIPRTEIDRMMMPDGVGSM